MAHFINPPNFQFTTHNELEHDGPQMQFRRKVVKLHALVSHTCISVVPYEACLADFNRGARSPLTEVVEDKLQSTFEGETGPVVSKVHANCMYVSYTGKNNLI